MLIKCKDVPKLTSDGRKHTLYEKIQLKIHLFMCEHCRNYVAGLNRVQDAIVSTIRSRASKAKAEDIKKIEDDVLKSLSERE